MSERSHHGATSRSQLLTPTTLPPLLCVYVVRVANSIRSVDQKVNDVSKKLQKLERVEAKMADFEKELSNLRVEINQSRVKTEEMITVLNDRADSVEFQF